MKLYLYTCANRHPEVMMRYRYLVLAASPKDAIRKMLYADGGVNEYCTVESCEQEPFVENNVWYLPINAAEPITD